MLDIILFSTDREKSEKTINCITGDSSFKNGLITIHYMDFNEPETHDKMICGINNDKIIYHNVHGKSTPEVFNYSLKISKDEYISFVTNDGVYQKNAFELAFKSLNNSDIASFIPIYSDDETTRSYLGFKVCFDKSEIMNIDLSAFPERFHLCLSAYIFKKSLFDHVVFDERMEYDSEWKVIYEILDDVKRYTIINRDYTYNEPDENDYFNYQPQFSKEWYMDTMDYFLIDAIKPNDSRFKQRFVLYMTVCRYACNMNERDKTILSPDEADDFINKTSKVLQNIEDVIICNNTLNGKARTPAFFSLNLLRMKYNDPSLMPTIISSGKNLAAYYKDSLLWTLGSNKIEFKVIYFDGKNLTMDGFFPGIYVFDDSEIEIVAMLNQSNEYPVRRNHIYALNKFFNISAKGNYTFQFSIPESELSDNMTISFYLKYQGRYYPMPTTFIRAQTKLSTVKNSYWVFGNHILSYKSKSKEFLIENLTRQRLIKHELLFIKSISASTHGMWKVKMVGNRLLYWITKPFYRQKIWLTMDKLFKAGDNGEYFYRYVKKVNPKGIKIYYVVQNDSPDYKRLKKEYNTIVKFNSIHHKMLALHTDLMLATHVDTMNCNGYYHATQKYFKDLYNARVVCLAHGLTIQRIAQYQNRVFDNTVLYFFASKYEIQNVSHEVYDYYDKNALQLTGHARYDGLISNDKKIILITPTWRRGITTGKAKKGSTYSHSDSFKNSEYYKIYNGLITDSKLINKAKEYGYRIVYLLHPAMSAQLEDFEKTDSVDIIAATSDISYEKILTESSLMVTDYSGVQFDFAYMKKPLIYYHPNSLPPQYEAGGLIYETMGFGPICRNHEEIIKTLCDYIENQCKMKDMYIDRVDDFFQYSDHNNCERIYEKVVEFQNKFDKVNNHKFNKEV